MTHPPVTGLTDWAELMLRDHGVLRLAWHNLHQIDAQMWRSNQPTPGRVEQAAKAGIKTIINLRGPRSDGGWKLEAEACKKANITLIDFTARSRAAPDKEMLYGARDLFNSIEKPALMHCKSGADRAGLMAALYVLIYCEKPVAEAMKQLSLRYLHVRQAKTGMLDSFFEAYAPYEAQGMAFFDWVDTIYDPQALHDAFMARPWAEKLVDGILRRE
jgi:protein tyrosine phosphatase (PTP) superfamily phosphohydrolase (DUF442 family)